MKRQFIVLGFLFTALLVACNSEEAADNKPGEQEKPSVKTARESSAKQEAKEAAKPRETSKKATGSMEEQVLTLVNQARKKGCNCGGKYYPPAPPLTLNNKLERAARKHSRYMKRKNLLTHTGKGRTTPGTRIKKEGYDWMSFGENVASGYRTPKEAVDGWLGSKGHCKNIMNPKFKEMGIAKSGDFWAQTFGSR